MLKQITTGAALLLAAAMPAWAGDAPATEPPGGAYQAVHELVPLPEFIPGMGKLYVDPATLPAGPFAAYDRAGKLVSTIYMVPLDMLTGQEALNGLAVAGDTVQSVDLVYNAGHPGVESPHYHIVLWHVDPAEAGVK